MNKSLNKFNATNMVGSMLALVLLALYPKTSFADTKFTCKIDPPLSQWYSCFFSVDMPDTIEGLPTIDFILRPGDERNLADGSIGKPYCHDLHKNDVPINSSHDACVFGGKWVGHDNDNTPHTGMKLIEPGKVRFGCQLWFGMTCRFNFANSESIIIESGRWIDVDEASLGKEFCAQIESNPVKIEPFPKCAPKHAVRSINDNRGTNFSRAPDSSAKASPLLPVVLIDNPASVGRCVLLTALKTAGRYDIHVDGFPIGYISGENDRFVGEFMGFPSRVDADVITNACRGKWFKEAFGKTYEQIPDFVYPSNDLLTEQIKLGSITYYTISYWVRCNAPAPGFLASRCEDYNMHVPSQPNNALTDFIHCRTDTTIQKRDDNTGGGWDVSENGPGPLQFRHWIAAESKTFQGGHEVEVTYKHIVIPRNSVATLGVDLNCNYLKFEEFGKKNGDWKL